MEVKELVVIAHELNGANYLEATFIFTSFQRCVGGCIWHDLRLTELITKFLFKSKLWSSGQGGREVTIYYNETVALLEELHLSYEGEWDYLNAIMRYKKERKMMKFIFFSWDSIKTWMMKRSDMKQKTFILH